MLMGYLLKEALKTLCGVNQWSYAVFWKIGCQNPKLLLWEESYYEPLSVSYLPEISGTMDSTLHCNNWGAGWVSAEASSSQLPAQEENKIHLLVNKMMMEKQLNIVGEGLVGRAAFTANHEWILSEQYTGVALPPEVLKEVCEQFSAGMQTVAVIPVLPHGVVQLGSRLAIMENLAFVNDVKSLVLQLGSVPGILLSDNFTTKEPSPKIALPVYPGKNISVETIDSTPFIEGGNCQINSTQTATGQVHDKLKSSGTGSNFGAFNTARDIGKTHDDHCQAIIGSLTKLNIPSVGQVLNGVHQAEVMQSNPDVWSNQASLSSSRSTFQQQSSINSLAENNSSLGFLEQRILSDAGFRNDNDNNFNMSNGFMMLLLRTTHENGASIPSLEASELYKDAYSHLKAVADLNSLDANRSFNQNIPSMNPAGNGFEHASSSKTELSASHMMGYLTTILSGHHSADNTAVKTEMKEDTENALFQAFSIPVPQHDEHLKSQSADDLFGILGVDLSNNLLNDSWNSFPNNGFDYNLHNFNKNTSTSWTSSDLYSVNQGNSESGIFSMTGPDHLLDAIVSTVHPSTMQSFDDNVSCKTTLANTSSLSVPDTSCSYARAGVSDQMQGEISGLPKSSLKPGSPSSCSFRSGSFKDNAGRAYSESSSIYGSQISSWVEQNHDSKQSSSVSTSYSSKSDEMGMSKSNRKRLKPGENPRPRPKDRQMIQDRVKELREIVPNGAKCSIDALLERTIKHMLFLQGVTKHADKLKQTGDMKIFCKGELLKDNFERGATWAYEVGSQTTVCPIIVEDLNEPRQMLVEMLCDEQGLFLEIADIIRGLGLTILKGVMETRNDKIWARFAVEANRDVTRMEIFISLARLLERTAKSAAAPTNGIDNDDIMVHQFHQAT